LAVAPVKPPLAKENCGPLQVAATNASRFLAAANRGVLSAAVEILAGACIVARRTAEELERRSG
jgi:hypothetical protein